MRAGEIVAGRFRIDRLAGAGGMGQVFLADDLVGRRKVALKLLRTQDADPERLSREAELLAALSHPGIVGYVGHGVTPEGRPYIAMEWLDGEDLGVRLERGRLSVADALAVVAQAAAAVGIAHARGIVHRDLKPANLFLVDGRIDRLKVLDFGIARGTRMPGLRTRTGAVLGTPSYMSPEQARGARNVDARSDVFSFGCVLYHCLTGHAPFVAEHVMAVLAKVLLEDVELPGSVVDGIPRAVDELIARLLAKEPDQRPADATALASELANLDTAGQPRHVAARTPSLTGGEEQLLSVVAVGPVAAAAESFDDTLAAHAETLSPGPTLAALLQVAASYGATLLPLADGSSLLRLAGPGSPIDLVAHAARCALAVRARVPGVAVSMATGRGLITGRSPTGEVIDRAIGLLRGGRDTGAVPIDQTTTALLDPRFEVRGADVGLELISERAPADGTRTLLGKPTPFVGREPELSMLDAALSASANEPVAMIVLVTAPAGVGKSRLRNELVRRLRDRDVVPQVWIGRGDPMRAGAPLGMIASALRAAFGLQEGEAAATARDRLRARLGRALSDALADRTAEFVGEIIGLHFPDDSSPALRTARQDPRVMRDQTLRAFQDLIAAECVSDPLLLVLEDLHWADPATIDYVDAAVRALHDRPFTVLALSRPEVHDQFPRLWAERGVQEIRLGQLPRRAAERLARHVLGPEVDEGEVSRVVDRAAGNAFFLEELIRATAEGRSELPETVLGMMSARLDGLDPEARRVLRAASVFGDVFWAGGVEALTSTRQLVGLLEDLLRRELIQIRPGGRFAGQAEYVFRHGLVREAAYATLTQEDRKLGHRLAGEWLEQVGEPDALTIAHQLERGDAGPRAAEVYARAAAQAVASADVQGALACCERAEACGAQGELMGRMRTLKAWALSERGERMDDVARFLRDAKTLLRPGGVDWFRAAELLVDVTKGTNIDELAALQAEIEAVPCLPEAEIARLKCLLRVASTNVLAGRFAEADRILAGVDDLAKEAAGADPGVAARLHHVLAFKAGFAGDREDDLRHLIASAELYERAGDIRTRLTQVLNVSCVHMQLGGYAEIERSLTPALELGRKLDHHRQVAFGLGLLAQALTRIGRLREARPLIDEALALDRAMGNVRYVMIASNISAELHWRVGELAAGAEDAQRVVDGWKGPERVNALALLGSIRLDQGRTREAVAATGQAVALLDGGLAVDEDEHMIRLAHVEALNAAGERERAREHLVIGRRRLLSEAERIQDPAARARMLGKVAAHARLLALAEEAELVD